MFTGLIQGMGRIDAADGRGTETRFKIRALFDLPDIVPGESIAVNGVCLTVETYGDNWFTAYASAETLKVTSLGDLRTGSRVNLERAMAMGDRFGGHIVSGHVDCLSEVSEIKPVGESRVYTLVFPEEHGKYVVGKGSVALDGISLTVNDCGSNWLSVNIIPATQQETTISSWQAGRKVNMETDVIGKYVQRMLAPYLDEKAAPSGGLTMDFLHRHGF